MDIVLRIVDKFIEELRAKLAPRKVDLILSDAARQWLADRGYDTKLGARPLGRLIQREIEDRLSDELLFGKLAKGGRVTIELQNDAVDFAFDA